MTTNTDTATIAHFRVTDDVAQILGVLDRDGAVIVDGLLSTAIVDRVNDEVDVAVAAADPDGPMFNPIAKAFMGAFTKSVPGVPGISRTFATDVMCNPVLLGLADAILGPNCARFQLNLGQILQRGPGSEDQWLHRDEGVWVDVPQPRPELQLASVIALVDFTRDNGATRVAPGSHRWPDRHAPMDQQTTPDPSQIAVAEMKAGSALIYTGGVIHGGGANSTEQPPCGAPQLLPRLVAHGGEQLPLDSTSHCRRAAATGTGGARVRGLRRDSSWGRLPRHGAHARSG